MGTDIASRAAAERSSREAPAVEIAVLGRVVIVRDGDEVRVGPRLQRLLAAFVAHRATNGVAFDTLVDIVWEGRPPANAAGTLRTYVSRLRRALDIGTDPIDFHHDGYRLDTNVVATDVERFDRGVRDATIAFQTVELDDAEQSLTRALERWHGTPYGAFGDEEWARPDRVRLEEAHRTALELQVEIMLAVRHTDAAIALASSLTQQTPLREKPHDLLMRALYEAGRQAEAMRVARRYRAHLAEETGLDPTPQLLELEERILRNDLPHRAPVARVRGYEIAERLGSGSMSVVHRASQPAIGRDVAIKMIRSELADRAEFVRRFEREGRLIASIEHPHVVPLYDFWREPGSAYLVMRLMRGGSLADEVRRRGPLSTHDVARVVRQVGGALSTAHRAGVVHNDVRPRNLLLDEDGATYLGDFGIATTILGSAWAPVHYAAPECLRDEPVGAAGDVFSFGVSIFELMSGSPPFANSDSRAELVRRQLGEPIGAIADRRDDVPVALDDVLRRATSKDPVQRHASIDDFVDEMLDVLGEGSSGRNSGARRPAWVGAAVNPYVGLHAFTEADEAKFHGRERLVDELVEAASLCRLVTVVGPSGSGKSSVVRAGLIPAIRAGRVAGSESWLVTTMFPGADPIEAFERALDRIAVERQEPLQTMLAEEGGLVRAVRHVAQRDSDVVLIVIDQFEELFTLVEEDARRDRFLSELGTALADRDCPLRVVATLRADHYDAPLREPALAEAVTDGTVTVRPLRADEVERAIVKPARSVDVEVEPALVAELVAAVSEHRAALPLLQFALTESFDRRVADVMLLDAFREAGGLTGALAARAERIIAGPAGDPAGAVDAQAVRAIFARLVTYGDGPDGDSRRRAPLDEFAGDADTVALIERFVDARLLTVDRDDVTRTPTIEVAHEALLREWPRLRSWTDDDRVDLRLHRRVTLASAEWETGGHDDGGLARGTFLEAVADLAERRPDLPNAAERHWVDASVARSTAERDAERAAASRDRGQNRRLRRLLTATAVLVVLATVAAVAAVMLRNRATDSERAAEARALVLEADRQLADDPELSMLLGMEAIEAFGDSGVAVPSSAGDLLRTAMSANDVVHRVDGGLFVDVTDDGAQMTTSDGDGGAAIYDVASMEPVGSARLPGYSVSLGRYLDDELVLLGESESGQEFLHETSSGWEPIIDGLQIPAGFLLHDEFSVATSGPYLAYAGPSPVLRVWNAMGGTSIDDTVWSAPTKPSMSIEASENGRLAYVTPENTIHVVDIADGRVVAEIDPGGALAAVAPSPDGTRVAALAVDGALTMFDAESGDRVWGPIQSNGLTAPYFSSDGRLIFEAGASGVDIIDAETGEVISSRASLAHVYDAAARPDSQGMFIATEQGSTMLLDPARDRVGREIEREFDLPGPRRWLEISDAGDLVALGMADASVIDPDSGAVLRETVGLPWGEFSDVRDVNLSTVPVTNLTGELVASADDEGYSRLWVTSTGEELYVAPAGWDVRAIANQGDRVLIHRYGGDSADHQARVVTLADGAEVDIVGAGGVSRGYFTPDDGQVVLPTGTEPNGIFDADTGERVVDQAAGGEALTGHFHMSPGGDRLIVGMNTGELVSLDLPQLLAGADADDATVFRVPAHGTFANPVVVSDDGAYIATVGRGEPVRLWDGETGEPIGSFVTETDDAGVVFDPEEPLVYLADGDRMTVHSFEIDTLVAAAREDVQRELTATECERFLDRSC